MAPRRGVAEGAAVIRALLDELRTLAFWAVLAAAAYAALVAYAYAEVPS